MEGNMINSILLIDVTVCAIAYYLIGRFGLENIKKYLHLIVLGFALFMLFIGVLNYQGAQYSKNFKCVPGYITDVKSTRRYVSKHFRTEYSCVIHYTFTDGKMYYTKQDGLVDKPNENLSKVWVSRDNEEVHMFSPKSSLSSSIFITSSFVNCMIFLALTGVLPYIPLFSPPFLGFGLPLKCSLSFLFLSSDKWLPRVGDLCVVQYSLKDLITFSLYYNKYRTDAQ